VIAGSKGLYEFLADDEICEIARAAPSPQLAAAALLETVKLRAHQENKRYDSEYNDSSLSDVTVGVLALDYPLSWKEQIARTSKELQAICDEVTLSTAADPLFKYSVCIADPGLEDCPLIAVSKGFEELTGYGVEAAIGRNCRFLNFGVPDSKRDLEMTERVKAFTNIATSGNMRAVSGGGGLIPEWTKNTPGGGAYFSRWNRRRDGALFRNLFVLRQIWIKDRTYLMALQTKQRNSEPTKEELSKMSSYCDQLETLIVQRMSSLEYALTPPFA